MMARATADQDTHPSSLSFHSQTFGQNVRLEDNGSKAIRHASFDHGEHSQMFSPRIVDGYSTLSLSSGVTFTHQPININERIHLKIIDVDETRQWCGSLAIGACLMELWHRHFPSSRFHPDRSSIDARRGSSEIGIAQFESQFEEFLRQTPLRDVDETIVHHLLLQSRVSHCCQGKITNDTKWRFPVVAAPITFSMDKKKKFVRISTSKSPCGEWSISTAMLKVSEKKESCASIHPSTMLSGVMFTSPPQTTDDGKSLFAKYPEKPDRLPIRYYVNLQNEDLKPVCFSNVHGAELELYCEYKVALRKRWCLWLSSLRHFVNLSTLKVFHD